MNKQYLVGVNFKDSNGYQRYEKVPVSSNHPSTAMQLAERMVGGKAADVKEV